MTGKKRVRRIQIELSFYRQQVQELELSLKRLKLQKSHTGDQKLYKGSGQLHTSRVLKADAESVWDGIAEGQFKERLRAEQQQKELQKSHSELTQLTTELLKLLEKYKIRQKEVLAPSDTTLQQRFQLLSSEADDKIFSEQLIGLARLRLELQQLKWQAPCRTVNISWGLTRGNMTVRPNPKVDQGVVMEMHCGTTVPFNLKVAARAYWRFFCLEHGEVLRSDTLINVSTDTITRSFSIRLEYEDLITEVSGKFTCQTSVEEDQITNLSVENTDVSEFAGIKFNGTQYQKRTCLKLRRVPHEGPGHQSTSTVVETHVETAPLFDGNVTNKLQQMEAFIKSAHRSHCKLNKIVSQTMGDMLLEEDWKATFG